MRTLILTLVMVASIFAAPNAFSNGGFDGAGGRQGAPPPACPTDILSPSELLTTEPDGRLVFIRGVVQNIGTNYFTDRRFVLADESSVVDVRPWLPLEVIGGIRRNGPQPPVMSDLLNTEIVVNAKYELTEVRGVGKKVPTLTDVRQMKYCN